MKKKIGMLLVIGFSIVFLVGCGEKEVELLNDKKLIDLDAAIEKHLPGADSATDDVNSENDKKPIEILQETTTDNKIVIEPEEKIIVIRVKDRRILYDSIELPNRFKLEEKIMEDNGDHVTFRLEDDFADADVYKQILSILSKLESEIGLNYTKE